MDYPQRASATSCRHLLFVAVAVLLSATCLGQDNFQQGYLVSFKGDTTRGWVDLREGTVAYKSCSFKSSPSQAAIEYGPDRILAYGIEAHKRFESRVLESADVS